ncbi:hypothetical protein HDV05_001032 [Chytridiales sp. JEL 0842]|nr:hypothetical protein HDV05_001032 [Chytridiales sp. JEL 0842]
MDGPDVHDSIKRARINTPSSAAQSPAAATCNESINLWDNLLPEIKSHILDLSDALTQHLNFYGKYSPTTLKLESEEDRTEETLKLHTDIFDAALNIWKHQRDLPDWYRLVNNPTKYRVLLDLFCILPRNKDFNYNQLIKNIRMRHNWPEYSFCLRQREISKFAKGGHYKSLLSLQKLYPDDVYRDHFEDLVVRMALEDSIFFVLQDLRWVVTKTIVDRVASEGCESLSVLEDLLDMTKGCTVAAMDGAAKNGHLHVVKFLHKRNIEGCTKDAMNGAAANGHLNVVKFLHENRSEGCTVAAMNGAAKNGHLAIVRFLHENRTEGCTSAAMNGAAGNGHLNVVKYLHENRREGCTLVGVKMAVKNSHPDVLDFLRARYPHVVAKFSI